MHLKRPHLPSLGVSGLLVGGLARIFAFYLHWPVTLVILSDVILVMTVLWLVVYDFFPLFLPTFEAIRQNYLRRHSFFWVLFLFFIAMQVVTLFLPSGRAKDDTTTLAFLSFLSSIGWLVGANFLLSYRPITTFLRRLRRREPERVTLTDIFTSMAIIVAPTVALSFFFSPAGLRGSEITPYQVFTTGLVTDAFIAGYLYLFVFRPKVFTLKQLGWRKVDREHLFDAFVLFVFISVLLFILQSLLQRLGVSLQQFSFSTTQQAPLALVTAVIITPIVEEVYFRGFLFRGLLLHHKPWVAYVGSSALFALLHPPLLVMIDVFCIGLLLAYVSSKTKSLWPGIVIHMFNNLIVLGYLFYR